ncbi:unnamed protein product [Prunus brigantina]
MDQRNVYAIPELDPTDNDIGNVADQRLESSMENDVETLRDTNSRTDFAYCAISGFDMFGPLDRIGFDGSWIGVPDTPKS